MSTVGQGAGYLVGAIAGSFIPGVGTMLGAQIGGMIGGYLDPPKQKGNKPQSDLSVQTATYGAPIGTGYGNYAKYGNLFWVEGNKLRLETGSSGGGKGGQKKSTPDEIYGTFAIGFGEGEITAFGRIWCNGKLVYDPTSGTLGAKMANGDVAGNLTFYTGSATQLPDPRMQADMGVAYTPAYRGLHWIMFSDWPMADYGNTLMGMQVKAEIINSATVTQYIRHLYIDNLIPDTNTYPGAGATEYGYFNPRIENGIFNCDKASLVNGYAVSYGISHEGALVYQRSCATETGEFGYIGACGAGLVTYSGFFTGEFRINGLAWKYKTSDENNTCHGMAVGGDGRIYALERTAGAWLFNIYDGDSLDLVSSGANNMIRSGNTAIAIPGIPGTNSTFCVENDGVHVWAAQESGGSSNFSVGEIDASGALNDIYAFNQATDGYLGAYSRLAAIAAKDGICYGVNDHGDFFVFDRLKTLTKTETPLASIIEKRCLLSGLISAGDIDTSAITQMVRGYKVDNVASIRNSLEPLQGAWPFDIIPSGYQIKFKPRGGSPVATIDIADLGAVSGNEKIGDILTQSREMDSQLPVKVQITYIDVNREYDKGTGPGAWRINTDAVNVQAIDMPIVLNADEAAGIEETLLYLYWMERADFNFTLPPIWNALEAADVFTVNEPGASYEFRMVEPIYLPDGRIECAAKLNSAPLYTWTAKGQEGQSTGQVLTYPGASLLELLDIPCVDSTVMDKPGILTAVAGYSADWTGGTLYRSDDEGQTWSGVQSFNAPGCTIGKAINAIGAASRYVVDFGNVLDVRLVSGSLSSVTQDAMFNGANHFAYGAAGRWEIIAAQNCAIQGDGTYKLSNLLRGRFGTEQYMTTHAIGDSLVLLDSASVRFVGMGIQSLNISRKWRPVTIGKSIDSASETVAAYTGVNLECLSPVDLGGYRGLVSLDWTLFWTRRSRTPVEIFSGRTMPLGESAESYVVEIWDSGYTTLKRTISGLSAATTSYSKADQITDFGSPQGTLYVKIYQVSANFGRGYPLITSITRAADPETEAPYYRVLGLHFNGTAGTAVFTDTKGHTMTAYGNAVLATDAAMFGGICGALDGTDDYIKTPYSAEWSPGSGDYSVRAWINPSNVTSLRAIIGTYYFSSPNTYGWLFCIGASGELLLILRDSSNNYYSVSSAAGVVQINQRKHVSWTKSGNVYRLFYGGTKVAEATITATIYVHPSSQLIVGRWDNDAITTRDFAGKIDDVDILKGLCIYDSNYPEPLAQFTD